MAMSLILIATLAGAWLLSSARAIPVELTHRHAPEKWPITFALPDIYEPVEESRGIIVFSSPSSLRAKSKILIMFTVVDEDTEPIQAAVKFTGNGVHAGDSIAFGSVDGRFIESRDGYHIPGLLAVATTPDGLAIAVQFASLHIGRRERALFRAICESIEYTEWSIPIGMLNREIVSDETQ